MKSNRWIIKAAKIITKFTELGYWMTAALMLTAGIYSFADRTFLADALAGSIRTGRLELSVLGFEFSVPTANGIDMRAMLLYFAGAVSPSVEIHSTTELSAAAVPGSGAHNSGKSISR